MGTLLLLTLLGQTCRPGQACYRPATVTSYRTVATAPGSYSLRDSAGTVWTHSDWNYLNSWVGQRNVTASNFTVPPVSGRVVVRFVDPEGNLVKEVKTNGGEVLQFPAGFQTTATPTKIPCTCDREVCRCPVDNCLCGPDEQAAHKVKKAEYDEMRRLSALHMKEMNDKFKAIEKQRAIDAENSRLDCLRQEQEAQPFRFR